MRYVPWPGFGPFESYDADHTVAGGERLELAGLEIDVLFTPGHSPGHVTYSIPAEQAIFSGDVLFEGSVGRTDLPGGDHATLMRIARDARGARCRTRPSCTPGTWATRRSAASAPRTRSWPSWRERQDPGTARHVRRAGRAGGRARGARGHGAADPGARRLRAHRDAGVRGDRAVRPRRRRVDRRRAEGDVHARGRGVAEHHAAPRGHRAGVPRLPRARHAQAAAAGEALVPVELLPPRAPAEGPLPPVLADRRRGDRLRRPGRRRRGRSCCWPSCSRPSARRGLRLRIGSLGTPETRRAYREELQAYLRAARGRSWPRRSSRGSSSTRCARSTPTTAARSR